MAAIFALLAAISSTRARILAASAASASAAAMARAA